LVIVQKIHHETTRRTEFLSTQVRLVNKRIIPIFGQEKGGEKVGEKWSKSRIDKLFRKTKETTNEFVCAECSMKFVTCFNERLCVIFVNKWLMLGNKW